MEYPEYDSPFMLNLCDITAQIAKNIDEMSWQAVQRVGINVDKEKLLIALKQDAERYREAYARGREAGYTKRDEELVRCKDCRWGEPTKNAYGEDRIICGNNDTYIDRYITVPADWFCAEGERRED